MSAQVAADLRAAAEVLRRDGWTQGSFYDPRTRCRCVVGAVRTAAGFRVGRTNPALEALEVRVGTDSVIEWNDAPGRTADEVIAALLAAAERAEETP